MKEVEAQLTAASALKLMLQMNDALFHVPPEVVAQLRYLNEKAAASSSGRKTSKAKDVRKMLLAKSKSKGDDAVVELDSKHIDWVSGEGAVRAQASVGVVDGADVHCPVTQSTTVKDVLSLVAKETGRDAATLRLVESGGNIDERCLRSLGASVLGILKLNRTGRLVVKAAK